MGSYVLGFQEIGAENLMAVGGKGGNLGELAKLEGILVPKGFCVTTEAFKQTIGQNQQVHALLEQLSRLELENKEEIKEISREIRRVIEEVEIAPPIEEELFDHLTELGEELAYAVRSSATAEDLPHYSFAGQQDSYLNIIGRESLLRHIKKCWASLFADRAVIYRIQNRFDHRKIALSVIIQQMIFPQVSGILFTADPVTSNRKVMSIDASFGLGEALVSGLVNADHYKVRDGRVIEKNIATKQLAINALPQGGTEERTIEADRQNVPALTDEQILQLAWIGKQIEAHFACPQDIEWCLYDNKFYIVQSRPITTLYPLPEGKEGENRVYLSFGHQQMMTDPIKPLGMSCLRFLTDMPLIDIGGRLFLDITHDMASPFGRMIALRTVGKNDPLTQAAIDRLVKRKDFIKALPHGKRMMTKGITWDFLIQTIKIYRKNDPAIVQQLIADNESSIEQVRQKIANQSGEELFTFILEDYKRMAEEIYHPRSMGAIMVGIFAAYWINNKMEKWLGEKNAADTLSQSVPYNITSEMGLELLDVADAIRPYPEVIAYLHQAKDETFFEDLAQLEGGPAASAAIQSFLEKYGMRCTGEIDITRTRWSEQPTLLIPMILGNISNFGPGMHEKKLREGQREAAKKEEELLSRLAQLPGGGKKVKKTKKMIRALRNFTGYREYPKYAFIKRIFLYKQALMKEAVRLVQKGLLKEKEEIGYLTFEEFREAVRTQRLDYHIITKRKEEYEHYQQLTPPRVMTSEGEIIFGEYNADHVPEGSLLGVPVSSGVIEGRARIVLKMEEANIEEGDILVTTFTDPSWTPLFVSIKGLVTEVGGMMTHGSVIAREYGLPAVVGVENATKRIKDGQRIRVNGSEGYIELL